jgi:hypothetical protein
MIRFAKRNYFPLGGHIKGTSIAEYSLLTMAVLVTTLATVSATGKKINEVFLGLGEQVAYVNREIATIDIAMDEVDGKWVIVDTSVEDAPSEPAPAKGDQEEPVPDGGSTEDGTGEPAPEEGAPSDPPADEPISHDGTSGESPTDENPQPEEPTSGEEPPAEEVVVEDAPTPEFRLTKNNGLNHAAIDFSKIDVPHRAYEFTLSGTGDSNPYVQAFSDGTETSGKTLVDRIQIRINKPSKGRIETITLVIAGQTLTWTVAHDHGNRGGGKSK